MSASTGHGRSPHVQRLLVTATLVAADITCHYVLGRTLIFSAIVDVVLGATRAAGVH